MSKCKFYIAAIWVVQTGIILSQSVLRGPICFYLICLFLFWEGFPFNVLGLGSAVCSRSNPLLRHWSKWIDVWAATLLNPKQSARTVLDEEPAVVSYCRVQYLSDLFRVRLLSGGLQNILLCNEQLILMIIFTEVWDQGISSVAWL